ncbi:MAG: ABC transporter ATP-binding protein [Leptospira sp.]|nr:ABC transporter ATP-binding protein [Leptospira sp.]
MSILTQNISKSFGKPAIKVLKDINLEIKNGEFISLSGKSGSGKSTLLYILSTLDTPSTGVLTLDDKDTSKIEESDLHKFRNLKMGFVFQFHYLLPELTALENVLMPARKTNQELLLEEKAKTILNEFGLIDKHTKKPSQLSGGEQQRVSIARSLIMEPEYIFADEPTGNLDSGNGKLVMDIFKKINKTRGTTVVYVTHDIEFANLAERKIYLKDGKIVNNL